MRIKDIIFNNFLAKAIALIFAIGTWFYVFDLVNSDSFSQKSETLDDFFSKYTFITKEAPVKPVFFGKSPEGYRVAFDKVKVVPSSIAIFGPEDIVAEVSELRTDKIDLSEYTRSVKITPGLHSGSKFLGFGNKTVDVYLPVEPVVKPAIKPETRIDKNE
ncbi:MAG: YbbR-like domain-containing protein [Candidatus Omnitrophota bacterium]